MRLKKEVLAEVRQNAGIRGRMCAELRKSYPTIQRWIERNGEGFTLAASLKILREELGLTNEEMLDDESTTKESTTKESTTVGSTAGSSIESNTM